VLRQLEQQPGAAHRRSVATRWFDGGVQDLYSFGDDVQAFDAGGVLV